MQDYGLVSIITPCYNSAEYIGAMIESVISQTYTHWELLITDDCSTDDSMRIVRAYAERDPRVRLFQLSQNSGAGVARNKSIEMASGRFIAFLDSDDRWMPRKLERQLAFMVEKDCALSYTAYMVCDELSRMTGIIVGRRRETFLSMLCDDGIGCLTAVYDTQKVGKVFMPLLRKRQDWGLWLTILKRCGVAYGLKEPLAIYRIRSGSISHKKSSLIRFNIAVYREVLGYSWLGSHFAFLCCFLPGYAWKKFRMRLLNG